ncbi:hypothetical protein J3458_004895 [Metarhizium acridum]|uniref:uncharacterized protein n=1 Tax=Metarhizium acridum TaxID=92637 RepID=UPI001C6B7FC3|nr:hypothetical protein J3458_004895 [Metarhizium acridum]
MTLDDASTHHSMIMAKVAIGPRDCIHSASLSDTHGPGNIILPRGPPPSITQGLLFPSRSIHSKTHQKKKEHRIGFKAGKQQLASSLSKDTNWHHARTTELAPSTH